MTGAVDPAWQDPARDEAKSRGITKKEMLTIWRNAAVDEDTRSSRKVVVIFLFFVFGGVAMLCTIIWLVFFK